MTMSDMVGRVADRLVQRGEAADSGDGAGGTAG